jgi:hypothetical protein
MAHLSCTVSVTGFVNELQVGVGRFVYLEICMSGSLSDH